MAEIKRGSHARRTGTPIGAGLRANVAWTNENSGYGIGIDIELLDEYNRPVEILHCEVKFIEDTASLLDSYPDEMEGIRQRGRMRIVEVPEQQEKLARVAALKEALRRLEAGEYPFERFRGVSSEIDLNNYR